ncbi:hypothetical protein EE612_036591 [Oryza sativa]|nr:hypothetical protein EE612_036591 [Oryza sativa]KAB8103979.1 hypothetical protein EE612_036591 [Oryza sativa]
MKGAKSKGAAKPDAKLAVKSKGAEKPAAKGRKGKAGKDPNKPKRAPSAFFVFLWRSSVRSSRRRTPRINLSLL